MLTVETMLLLTPLVLFLTDVMAKVGFRVSTESIGADLCMYAISFHFTSLLLGKMTYLAGVRPITDGKFEYWQTYTAFTLAVSLLCWFGSLLLISADPHFPAIGFLTGRKRLSATLAVCLGMCSLYMGVYLYVSV